MVSPSFVALSSSATPMLVNERDVGEVEDDPPGHAVQVGLKRSNGGEIDLALDRHDPVPDPCASPTSFGGHILGRANRAPGSLEPS
jgi:hypothetical protein